jgi:hypothetical protein
MMIYEKDILMRSLAFFLQKLVEFVRNDVGSEEEKIEVLNTFYEDMLRKDRDYFVNLETEDILREFGGENSNIKIRILAELFYVESIMSNGYERKYFAKKSLKLFEYFSQNGTVYDMDVFQKKDTLLQIITK